MIRLLNILMVSQYFPPFMGGKELWVYHVSRQLVERGHRVTVLTSDVPFHGVPYQFKDGIHVYRTRTLHDVKMYYCPIVPPNLAVLRRSYDIIHLHEPSTIVVSPLLLRARSIPMVATVYNDPSPLLAYKGLTYGVFNVILKAYYYSFFKKKLDWATHLLVLSDLQVERSRFLPLYRDKLSVVGMGIDPSLFPETESTNVGDEVLFVGRIDTRKGLDILIKAMRSLPKAKLKVVGSGSKFLMSWVKACAAQNGVVVDFVGGVQQQDLWKVYREAAVVCLPSTHPMETFGTVVLESWAMRKPVIVSRMVGCSPLVERFNGGLVVETGDVDGLTRALQTLLSNKTQARVMGENGYRNLKNFSYERIVNDVEKIYTEISK